MISSRVQTSFDDGCLKNDMCIHLKKTCCMSIGTRQTLMQSDSLDIFLKDEHIKTVDSQKLLGIINDKSLTWDKLMPYVWTFLVE